MNGAVIHERLAGRHNILLLQGPVGPFFDHLARFLRETGREVTKVNLNGGDAWFYRQPGAIAFTQSPDQWPHFLDRIFAEREIDALVLFGDCRGYHRAAIIRARQHSIPVFVFEEGYVRPNFVTFEPGGVNGNSMLPRSPALIGMLDLPEFKRPTKGSFRRMARYAMTYYLAGRLARSKYPNYRHHKPFDIYPEAFYWLRSGYRKLLYRVTEHGFHKRLTGELRGKYFLVPLQVFNDSQIKSHSDFRSVRAVIAMVLDSFARHAPADAHLVFKHHPMDRGHRHYGRQIRESASEAGIEDRVHYVHDLHLPSLLQATRGVVLVNSTTGLSALYHGAPVKVLGECIYDIPGLTHQGDLTSFWRAPTQPDHVFYTQFRKYLIALTQVQGSFYSGRPVAHGDPVMPRIEVPEPLPVAVRERGDRQEAARPFVRGAPEYT